MEVKGWGLRLSETLKFQADVLVRGKRGYTSDKWSNYTLSLMQSLPRSPSLVIIWVGNDEIKAGEGTNEAFQENVQSIIHALRSLKSDVDIAICEPVPVTSQEKLRYWEIRRILKDTGGRFGIPVFDTWTAFFGTPATLDSFDLTKISFDEQLQLTEEGHLSLWKKLQEFFNLYYPVLFSKMSHQ